MEAINLLTRKFIDENCVRGIKKECRYHLLNEISATIMQRKFHDHYFLYNKFFDDQNVAKLNVMKTFFIESYATHPDLEKVIAIYDAEISLCIDKKYLSFEEFVISNPDFTKWFCSQFMPKDASSIRIDCMLLNE